MLSLLLAYKQPNKTYGLMLTTTINRQGVEYKVFSTESNKIPGKYTFTVQAANPTTTQWIGCGQYETPEEALLEGIRHAREDKATWRELITLEMEARGETWADLVSITLTEEELDQEFLDLTWWGLYGKPFTAWSTNYVYFPVGGEDCLEYVSSVPRNPNGEPTAHIGASYEGIQGV